MFRNNLNIPNDEIALLKKRVRLTAEKLKQENDAPEFITCKPKMLKKS